MNDDELMTSVSEIEYDMECELMTTLEDLELVMDLEDVEFQQEIEWLRKEIMILNGEEESNPPSGNFALTHVEGKDSMNKQINDKKKDEHSHQVPRCWPHPTARR